MITRNERELAWKCFGIGTDRKGAQESVGDSSLEWAGNADLKGEKAVVTTEHPSPFKEAESMGLLWLEDSANRGQLEEETPDTKEQKDPLIIYKGNKKRVRGQDQLGQKIWKASDLQTGHVSDHSGISGRFRSRSRRGGERKAQLREQSRDARLIAKVYLLRARKFNLKSLLFSKPTLTRLAESQIQVYSEMKAYFGGRDLQKALEADPEDGLKGEDLERELMTDLFPTLYRSQNTYSDFSSSSLEEEESRMSQQMYKVLDVAVRYKDVVKLGTGRRDAIYEKIFKPGRGLMENNEFAGNGQSQMSSRQKSKRREGDENNEVFFESFGKSFFGKEQRKKNEAKGNENGKDKSHLNNVFLRRALKSKIQNWAEGRGSFRGQEASQSKDTPKKVETYRAAPNHRDRIPQEFSEPHHLKIKKNKKKNNWLQNDSNQNNHSEMRVEMNISRSRNISISECESLRQRKRSGSKSLTIAGKRKGSNAGYTQLQTMDQECRKRLQGGEPEKGNYGPMARDTPVSPSKISNNRSCFEGYLANQLGVCGSKLNWVQREDFEGEYRRNLIYFDSKKKVKIGKINEIYKQSQERNPSHNKTVSHNKAEERGGHQANINENEFVLRTKDENYDFSRREAFELYKQRRDSAIDQQREIEAGTQVEKTGHPSYIKPKQICRNLRSIQMGQPRTHEHSLFHSQLNQPEAMGHENDCHKHQAGTLGQNLYQQDQSPFKILSHRANTNSFSKRADELDSIYNCRKFSGQLQKDLVQDPMIQIYTPPKRIKRKDQDQRTDSSNIRNHESFESNDAHNFRKNTCPEDTADQFQMNLTIGGKHQTQAQHPKYGSYFCSSILETESKRNFGRKETTNFKKSPRITSNVKIRSISGQGNGSSTLSSAQDFLRVETSFPSLVLNQPINMSKKRLLLEEGSNETIPEMEVENEALCENGQGDSHLQEDEAGQSKARQIPNLSNGRDIVYNLEGSEVYNNVGEQRCQINGKDQARVPNMKPGNPLIDFDLNHVPPAKAPTPKNITSKGSLSSLRAKLSSDRNITEESNLLEDELPQSSFFSNQEWAPHPATSRPRIFESIFSFKHDSVLLSSRVALEGRMVSGPERVSKGGKKRERKRGITSLADHAKIRGQAWKRISREQRHHNNNLGSSKGAVYAQGLIEPSDVEQETRSQNCSRETHKKKTGFPQNSEGKIIIEDQNIEVNSSENPVQSDGQTRGHVLEVKLTVHGEVQSKVRFQTGLINAKSNPDFFRNYRRQTQSFMSNQCSDSGSKRRGERGERETIDPFAKNFARSMTQGRRPQIYTPKKNRRRLRSGSAAGLISKNLNNSRRANGSYKKSEENGHEQNRKMSRSQSQSQSRRQNRRSNDRLKKDLLGGSVQRKPNRRPRDELSISSNLCVLIARKTVGDKPADMYESALLANLQNNARVRRISKSQNEKQKRLTPGDSRNSQTREIATVGQTGLVSNVHRGHPLKDLVRENESESVPKKRISETEIRKLGLIIEEQREFIRSRSRNKHDANSRQKENRSFPKKRRKRKRKQRTKENLRTKKQKKGNTLEQSNFGNQRLSRKGGEGMERSTVQQIRKSVKQSEQETNPKIIKRRLLRPKAGGYQQTKGKETQADRYRRYDHSELANHNDFGANDDCAPMSQDDSVRIQKGFHKKTTLKSRFVFGSKQPDAEESSEEFRDSETGYQDTIKKSQTLKPQRLIRRGTKGKNGNHDKGEVSSKETFCNLQYGDLHKRNKGETEDNQIAMNRSLLREKISQNTSQHYSSNIASKCGYQTFAHTPKKRRVKALFSPSGCILAKKSFHSLISGISRNRKSKPGSKKVKKAKTRKSGVRSHNQSLCQGGYPESKALPTGQKSRHVILAPHSMTLNKTHSNAAGSPGRHLVYTNPLRHNLTKMDKWESLTSQVQNLKQQRVDIASNVRSELIHSNSGLGINVPSDMFCQQSMSPKKIFTHQTFQNNFLLKDRGFGGCQVIKSVYGRKSANQLNPSFHRRERTRKSPKRVKVSNTKKSQTLIQALSKGLSGLKSQTRKQFPNSGRESDHLQQNGFKKINLNRRGGRPLGYNESTWNTNSQLYGELDQRPFTCKKPSKTAFFRSFKKSFEMSRVKGEELTERALQRKQSGTRGNKAKLGNYSSFKGPKKQWERASFFRTKN